ncbi:MAG: FkbM family methyltransferase [Simkaniaceae bacterium]|nr:FkbM family methyltransferase [Candidatus Sacchlamyda saccharinae]
MKIKLFLLLLCGALSGEYYSQCGQDSYVYETFFKGKTDGVFVDIGANDGVTYSNTLFFENDLGWTGICIEPLPEVFVQLERNRTCKCIEGCIGPNNTKAPFLHVQGPSEMLSGLVENYVPEHLQRIEEEIDLYGGGKEEILVDSYNLNGLLFAEGIDHVDFLSLDTEGGELQILQSIDFDQVQIDVITVENNYADPEFAAFMLSRGYRLYHTLMHDQIFVHRSLIIGV